MLLFIYMYFPGIFLSFFIKNFVFYHFHFFFWWSIEFPLQNMNQSETGIGDKKLSVKPYARINGNKSLAAILLSRNQRVQVLEKCDSWNQGRYIRWNRLKWVDASFSVSAMFMAKSELLFDLAQENTFS